MEKNEKKINTRKSKTSDGRTFISDEKFKEVLFDCVVKGLECTFTKTSFHEYLKKLYKIDLKRCMNLYDEFYPQFQKERREAKISASLSVEEKLDVEKAIGTKYERLLVLKGLIDQMLIELKDGQVSQTKFVKGKPMIYKRPMTQTEKNFTRKTIKEVQGEISKIEGDYAELKISGEINNTVTYSDIENLSEEEQLLILEADKILNKR